MAQYGSLAYWDERYRSDSATFEWFQSWDGIKGEILKTGIKQDDKIIVLGCGTSNLSEDMNNDGFRDIVSIDYSSTCIQLMQEKSGNKSHLIYKQMDCTDMQEFEDGAFDVAIDKGTLDTLLCGENSSENVKAMLSEVFRILKPDGMYICVSYGNPTTRQFHLQTPQDEKGIGWDISIVTVDKPTLGIVSLQADSAERFHYIYICKKSKETSDLEEK